MQNLGVAHLCFFAAAARQDFMFHETEYNKRTSCEIIGKWLIPLFLCFSDSFFALVSSHTFCLARCSFCILIPVGNIQQHYSAKCW